LRCYSSKTGFFEAIKLPFAALRSVPSHHGPDKLPLLEASLRVVRQNGKAVRMNIPNPKKGQPSLPQKVIARWPQS
jgi:hypothetical protein